MADQQETVPIQKVKNNGKRLVNSSEGAIYNYFRNKGYSVSLGKFISNDSGAPDFFVEKGNDKFWVEVKTYRGAITCEQIEWMINYNDEKIFIAIVKEYKHIKFIEIKVSDTVA